MSSEVQKNNQTKSRDYDKDPIIIVDRMPEISFWALVIFFLIALVLVSLFVPIAKDLNWEYTVSYFAVMYGITFIFLKSKITKIRTISLYNEKIVRQWDEHILEMEVKEIREVRKSFLDFYDSRQKALTLYKPIYYLLMPISFLLQHPTLIVIKSIYKILHGFSNKTLFDTVVIFDINNEMIAIFIPTSELKEELKIYFMEKGYGDIDDLSIFYTNQYSPDELTHYFNKKDK